MYCTRCGAPRAADAAFCSQCGVSFGAAAAPGATSTGTRQLLLIGVAALVLVLIAGAGAAVLLLGHGPGQPEARTGPVSATSAGPARTTPTHRPHPSRTPSPTTSPVPRTSPAPTQTPQTFAGLYRDVAHGVVRLETTACEGGGVGTGFLVAPNLVATVAHVVDGAVSVAVHDGRTTTTGTVVGIDPHQDLALVRTGLPLTGHVFGLARRQPPVGTAVGTIGYPLGGPKSFTTGAVSGLGRDLDIGHMRMSDLIQTDAGINPGNSGGPLLDLDGDVVGLVDAKATDAENIGYAIPASLARTRLAGWRADPSPVRPPGDCSAPTGPDEVTLTVTDHSQDAAAPGIADTLATYANAINDGDYRTAYHLLTPRDQRAVSYDTFSRGTASTLIVSMDLDSVDTGTATRHAEVRFTSVQDQALGHDGQSCSDWRMTYTVLRQEGGWRIDRARPHAGSPTAC